VKNVRIKAAFSTWDDRIAPVFDVAEKIILLEVEDGRIVRETRRLLAGDHPEEKSKALIETGASSLVCGAISRFLYTRITAGGIRVTPFIAGNTAEVIQAWIHGILVRNVFAMPGCCGRRRRGMGSGAGSGRGRGRVGGGGVGSEGVLRAAGPGGECVCPKCGHTEPHKRGRQYFDRTCPKCGIAMDRR